MTVLQIVVSVFWGVAYIWWSWVSVKEILSNRSNSIHWSNESAGTSFWKGLMIVIAIVGSIMVFVKDI